MNPRAEVPSSIIGDRDRDAIKKALFRNAMRGNWEEIINIYKQWGEIARTAKITRSGDTAIHIAISSGLEEVVESLVSSASTTPGSLKIENELGNTPLHLAASLGNVRMCEHIANHDPTLIGIRNKDSETPFFLAVHHGRKDAFLRLHSICKNGEGYKYCRKNDGETILHSAISGEYFDIAFQVIHLYPELVNSVTEDGVSALHVLASKPSAFRSGSHIRGFHKLFYNCILVDDLKEESSHHSTPSQAFQCGDKKKYPENYKTCVGFVLSLRNIIRTLIGSRKSSNDQLPDAERQQTDQTQGESTNTVSTSSTMGQGSSTSGAQGQKFFPENYVTCYEGLKLLSKAMLIILGLGSMQIVELQEKKEKHIWSVQVMEKLLQHASLYEYEDYGRGIPHFQTSYATPESLIGHQPSTVPDDHNPLLSADNSSKADQDDKQAGTKGTNENGTKEKEREMKGTETPTLLAAKNGIREMVERILQLFPVDKGTNENGIETPILLAAKNGIIEMVERILELFPVAIHDVNDAKKNIVLLAVENRQPRIYKFLLRQHKREEALFRQLDENGNSALHLAAVGSEHRRWLIPGAALQMQWEIKWYEFVKTSMPLNFFPRYNKDGKTPWDILTDTHKDLVKDGGKWLTSTSQSCSVVAALIATVAFATSSTFPGGVKSDSGIPILEHQLAFSIFAISSLIALCFSVTSLVMFLVILTSRHQEEDFGKGLPKKLLAGLTSLFVSIASVLVSFCAGHFFVLKDKLHYAAFPVYAVTCLPVTFYAIAQFPLYFDLIRASWQKVPRRSYK